MNHIAPLCNPSFSFVLEAIGFPIWFCMLFVCKGVEAMCTKHLRISSALRSPLAISFRSRETRDPDPWRGSCWHCWPSWRSGKEWNETWFFSLMLRVILEFWRIDRYMSHFFHIHSICSAFFFNGPISSGRFAPAFLPTTTGMAHNKVAPGAFAPPRASQPRRTQVPDGKKMQEKWNIYSKIYSTDRIDHTPWKWDEVKCTYFQDISRYFNCYGHVLHTFVPLVSSCGIL